VPSDFKRRINYQKETQSRQGKGGNDVFVEERAKKTESS